LEDRDTIVIFVSDFAKQAKVNAKIWYFEIKDSK